MKRLLDKAHTRLARRSLTLRPAHAHGHQVATAIQRLQTFRHLHACSGCFRLERMPGGTCTHWKTPPCTAHGTRNHLKLLFESRGLTVLARKNAADCSHSCPPKGMASSPEPALWFFCGPMVLVHKYPTQYPTCTSGHS